jgi:hypothetical protein
LIAIDVRRAQRRSDVARITHATGPLTKPLAAEVLTVWLLGQQALILKGQAPLYAQTPRFEHGEQVGDANHAVGVRVGRATCITPLVDDEQHIRIVHAA